MKRLWVLLSVLALLGTVSCEKKEGATETASVKAMAACPMCGKKMVEDAYCDACNAVATAETELVHCEECDKDFKPGTYCAQCNRFMLNAKVHCGNCQDMVVKGHFCIAEKLFKGLPEVAYCLEHGKPYAKSQTCPDCQKQPAETDI
jgi:hypothetical protein